LWSAATRAGAGQEAVGKQCRHQLQLFDGNIWKHILVVCLVVFVQALAKKLLGGSGVISCMAVHPSGDHVIVGSEDKRLAWCAHSSRDGTMPKQYVLGCS
jgi:hypothetical protein